MNQPLEKLTHELARLPGVGERTALRLALFILRRPPEYARELARALTEAVEKVRFCGSCFNLAAAELCDLCLQPGRDDAALCVVQDVAGLMTLERARVFKGRYHVLHGALSPMDGVGPEDLRLDELKERLRRLDGTVREVILATDQDVNGDATALYITRLIRQVADFKITRLAAGVPVGGRIEYADAHTLGRAFERRAEFL